MLQPKMLQLVSLDTENALKSMEKYQIRPNPDCGSLQGFCNHFNSLVILEPSDVDAQFVLKCHICDHTLDAQLYVLVMPSFISITLAHLLLQDLQRLYGRDYSSVLLCTVQISVPEHPVIIPILSYFDYQCLFRWLALIVGCFYDLQYVTPTASPSLSLSHRFFNDQIMPICYNYSHPENIKLVEEFPNTFTRLLIRKTKELQVLSENESSGQIDHIKQLLEITCTILENVQKDTLKLTENPLGYVTQTYFKYFTLITGKPYLKPVFNCNRLDGNNMPLENSYQWYDLLLSLFNEIRIEHSRYVFKLDMVLSIVPLLSIFSAKPIPERYSKVLGWLSDVPGEQTGERGNLALAFAQETQVNTSSSLMAALSFPCYWICKIAFGHYDHVFQQSILFKTAQSKLAKFIGPKSFRQSKSHCREHYYLAKQLRALDTAPDIEMITGAQKLGSEINPLLHQIIVSSATNLHLQLSATEVDDIVAQMFPFVVFSSETTESFNDCYYLFMSTYWIHKRIGFNKVTGQTLGKYKARANDLAQKLKRVFVHIRSEIGCGYFHGVRDVVVDVDHKPMFNVYCFNPLHASNMISQLQRKGPFSDLLYAFMAVMQMFPSDLFNDSEMAEGSGALS